MVTKLCNDDILLYQTKYAIEVSYKAHMLTSKASFTPIIGNDTFCAYIGDVFKNSTYY